ncbi:hypothetical protein [Shewanella mesophila]|uniref:hypothetical protein n=1 Tax=Shewanella mesophila TaxID=2864208 RepID=UPI0021AC2E97|nr:hypothetical protein [Shewanella mesophila]
MAIRLLAENYHDDFVQLSKYLKTDYFEEKTARATPKINKLDRYGYRDYLTPNYLIQDNKHRHFQNDGNEKGGKNLLFIQST